MDSSFVCLEEIVDLVLDVHREDALVMIVADVDAEKALDRLPRDGRLVELVRQDGRPMADG